MLGTKLGINIRRRAPLALKPACAAMLHEIALLSDVHVSGQLDRAAVEYSHIHSVSLYFRAPFQSVLDLAFNVDRQDAGLELDVVEDTRHPCQQAHLVFRGIALILPIHLSRDGIEGTWPVSRGSSPRDCCD